MQRRALVVSRCVTFTATGAASGVLVGCNTGTSLAPSTWLFAELRERDLGGGRGEGKHLKNWVRHVKASPLRSERFVWQQHWDHSSIDIHSLVYVGECLVMLAYWDITLESGEGWVALKMNWITRNRRTRVLFHFSVCVFLFKSFGLIIHVTLSPTNVVVYGHMSGDFVPHKSCGLSTHVLWLCPPQKLWFMDTCLVSLPPTKVVVYGHMSCDFVPHKSCRLWTHVLWHFPPQKLWYRGTCLVIKSYCPPQKLSFMDTCLMTFSPTKVWYRGTCLVIESSCPPPFSSWGDHKRLTGR